MVSISRELLQGTIEGKQRLLTVDDHLHSTRLGAMVKGSGCSIHCCTLTTVSVRGCIHDDDDDDEISSI